jgi:hypothetical protein
MKTKRDTVRPRTNKTKTIKQPTKTIENWLIVNDIHASVNQEQDETALAAMEDFASSKRWDGYANLGDLTDFSIISKHTKNKNDLRAMEKGRILEELRAADTILTRHEKIIRGNNSSAQMVYLAGNHEARLDAYIDQHPELEGMIEIPKVLNLNQRRIQYVDAWGKGELFQLGNVFLHHGLYTSEHAAKRMVQNFNRNILFGHCHSYQGFSSYGYRSSDVLVGASLGCLCKIPQRYLNGAPTKWCHMVTVLHVEPLSGNFWFQPIQIHSGKLCYDGKLYGGK